MKYFHSTSWLKKITVIILSVLFYSLLFPKKTYAYIDPASGSIIIQVLLGFLVGGMVTLKIFWNRIKTCLKKLFRRKHEDEQS